MSLYGLAEYATYIFDEEKLCFECFREYFLDNKVRIFIPTTYS